MTAVFAATNYWVALLNPRDQWHRAATAARQSIADGRLLTTDSVLVEVLNYFCARGQAARVMAAWVVRDILDDPNIEVIIQTSKSFLEGLSLYESRSDKGYSLTDCMAIWR